MLQPFLSHFLKGYIFMKETPKYNSDFPKTRYQGSKYKLRTWIFDILSKLEFNSVLDAFSGTSSISHLLKDMGKEVHSNDILPFNYHISKALIENSKTTISDIDFKKILIKNNNIKYETFIEDTFSDIYYLDHENQWLDIIVQNIHNLQDEYKKSMFFWALFQSCISKRPYNLFHRKNLHIRTKEVERSFGNKTTWDRPFEEHFYKFVQEINKAIIDNGKDNTAHCSDVQNLEINVDLVYIDPPYIPKKGSLTSYGSFYHFLTGLVEYNSWNLNIDHTSKHKKLKTSYSIWEDKKNIRNAFENMIEKYKDSIIVISYRDDGIPSIDEIKSILEKNGQTVKIESINYQYVFSKNKNLKEVILIGTPNI